MEGDGDVLDGLFDAIVGDVGLSEVIVGDDQPEIWFAVVKHQKFIEGQLLDFYVDQVLARFLAGCLVEAVQFIYDLLSDEVWVSGGVPW